MDFVYFLVEEMRKFKYVTFLYGGKSISAKSRKEEGIKARDQSVLICLIND